MAKMDHDFFEFRKKVFSGNQKNKNAHIETVNVDELNDRYFNELTSNGTLIHAKSALYGMQHKNVAYYKREGTPGNYKYYYTEEEYRKAHSGDQASSDTTSSPNNVKESIKQKYSKNPQNNESSKTYVGENGNIYRQQADGSYKDSGIQWSELRKNATAAADMKIEEAARNGGIKSAVGAIMKDERIKEMLDQFEGGFENNNWTLNYDGSISGMGQEDTDYFNKMNDWVKTFQKTSGVDIYNSKDYQDAVTQEIQKRWDKVTKQKEHGKLYREGKTGNGEKKDNLNLDSVKNKNEEEEANTRSYAAEQAAGEAEKYQEYLNAQKEKKAKEEAAKQKKEEKQKKESKESKNEEKSVEEMQKDSVKRYSDMIKNSSSKDAAREAIKNQDFGVDELLYEIEEAIKDGSVVWDKGEFKSNGDASKYKAARNNIVEIFTDLRKWTNQIGGKEFTDAVNDALSVEIQKLNKRVTEDMANSKKKKKKSAKHSGLEGDRIMNINKVRTSSTGEEIMDAYRSFKERANRGARMNQLSHSTIISANELNERYEEELLNQCILVHASNNYKYYNKIDLPNGGTRYFYTKAEWDAYNKEKGVQKLKNVLNKNKKAKGTPVAGAAQFITEAVDTAKTELDKQEKERKEEVMTTGAKRNAASLSIGFDTALQATNKVAKNMENEWGNKFKENKKKNNNRYDDGYKDFDDIVEELHNENNIKTSQDIASKFGTVEKYFQEIEKRCQEEYDKQKKAEDAATKAEKDEDIIDDIYDEIESLSKVDVRELSDLMGVDLRDENAVFEKYAGITVDEFDELEENHAADDYGLAYYEVISKIAQGLWNDYKVARKQAGISGKKKK